MKRKHGIFLGIISIAVMGVSLSAQEGEGGKASLTLDFSASAVSINSDGDVDSFTDAGFGDGDSTLSFSYENEFYGGTASFKFANEALRIFNSELGDYLGNNPFSIDELYAWVKPFGEHFKFTGGIFENTGGIADYTDDIDDFPIGLFMWGEVSNPFGEDGHPFREPTEITNAALVSGFLAETTFGPITAQLLLAPNYSKESTSAFASDLLSQMSGSSVNIDSDARFFRIGGRLIADAGVGTISALFKTFQWPVAILNATDPNPPPGTTNYHTFGAYFDFTAVENLGVSLGYTGFLPYCDADDVDNILWHGIDFRATWKGIEGLSLSTHNNISFAKGAKNDWITVLPSDDSSYLTLYNAIGATKELTDRFSINAEIANVLSITDNGDMGKIEFDEFFAGAKLITHITENAEFNIGLGATVTKNSLSGSYGDEDKTLTVFSVPIGITVSF